MLRVHAPVQTLPEVLDDPHFRQRGIVTTDARGWDHITSPIRFSDEPAAPCFDMPALGEHSHAVLKGIGYTDDEIARLVEAGAVKAATPDETSHYAGSKKPVSQG